MNSDKEQSKKCFCAQCFMPIDPEDRINVDGQNFHKICCLCCVCRKIPSAIKMFYGHVFCSECFRNQVMCRFRGESPRMQCSNWWMQWGPGVQDSEKKSAPAEEKSPSDEPVKKVICSRCLQAVDEAGKVDISGQSFHADCAKCYCCHMVPKANVKIYYGQLFCQECFQRHVLPRNRDNPSDFFKFCFDQWQTNSRFSEDMKDFMGGGANNGASPIIFMAQGARPSCRCGAPPQEWFQPNNSKNYKGKEQPLISQEQKDFPTPADPEVLESEKSIDMDLKCSGDLLQDKESANLENFDVATKIKTLTQLISEKSSRKRSKKWQNFVEHSSESASVEPSLYGWVDLQQNSSTSLQDCPKCLWQCGPIYVSCDYLKDSVTNCVEYSS